MASTFDLGPFIALHLDEAENLVEMARDTKDERHRTRLLALASKRTAIAQKAMRTTVIVMEAA